MKTIITLGTLATLFVTTSLDACCPVGRFGKPVMNADQTVIILWDAANQKQHFIRKASFAAQDQDFGFIIPTPNEPELSESGNDAFATLQKLTEPEVIKRARQSDGGCGCGSDAKSVVFAADAPKAAVSILKETKVAGFDAVVLEAKSSTALNNWLKEHGYAYSAELAAWAQPYIDQGWKFTALKVSVKDKADENKKLIEATALRLSFKTDRPLFPYREPAYGDQANQLNQRSRLLRIYIVADTTYHAEVNNTKWSGLVAWAGTVDSKVRQKILDQLKLPGDTGPANWHLTEFEDNWPYTVAAGDVYFSRDLQPASLKRPPIYEYTKNEVPGDVALYAVAGIILLPPLLRRRNALRSAI